MFGRSKRMAAQCVSKVRTLLCNYIKITAAIETLHTATRDAGVKW
jgi:hypothetical protein